MMLKFFALFRDSTLHVHLCAPKAIGGLSSLFVYLTHFALTLDDSFNYKSFKTSQNWIVLQTLLCTQLQQSSTLCHMVNNIQKGQAIFSKY